jgi:hypothetical protein
MAFNLLKLEHLQEKKKTKKKKEEEGRSKERMIRDWMALEAEIEGEGRKKKEREAKIEEKERKRKEHEEAEYKRLEEGLQKSGIDDNTRELRGRRKKARYSHKDDEIKTFRVHKDDKIKTFRVHKRKTSPSPLVTFFAGGTR